MRVISMGRLRAFWQPGHRDAERPLRDWYRRARAADWSSIADVRRMFPHADAVETDAGTLTVFNIAGNKYRLITRIRYEWRLVNVRGVLTHDAYDKGQWKEA